MVRDLAGLSGAKLAVSSYEVCEPILCISEVPVKSKAG